MTDKSRPVSEKTVIKPLSQIARERKGLTLEQIGKQYRYHPRYLRSLELHGRAPWKVAEGLAKLYGCSVSEFMRPTLVQVIRTGGLTLEHILPPTNQFSRAGGASARLRQSRKRGVKQE